MGNKSKFSLFAAAMMLIVSSCGTNPVEEAIVAKVKDTNPDVEVFKVLKSEQDRAVTLREELDRRRALFVTKEKASRKAMEKFIRENKQKNAAIQMESGKIAEDIIARIDAYKESHSASLDSIVYYIVKFSGKGRTYDEALVEVEDYYVTITPDCRALSLIPAGGNPYRKMGLTIPGYFTEILGREEEETGVSDED